MQRTDVVNFLLRFDIIYILEIKTAYPFSVPGFMCIRSKVIEGEELRGGVAVLMRSWLFETQLYDVNILPDQVWFRLHLLPDLLMGAIYIPPHDSPYFNNRSFAYVQEQGMEDPNCNMLILGDLNARIGDLENFNNQGNEVTYTLNPDSVINNHGRVLRELCSNLDLVPVNNLKKGSLTFTGGLTYRQGQVWKSQIDWAICSLGCLECVEDFQVVYESSLPSNHAPIYVTVGNDSSLFVSLVERSRLLKSSLEIDQKPNYRKKSLKASQIDKQKLSSFILEPETVISQDDDDFNIDRICKNLNDVLHTNTLEAERPVSRSNVPVPQENRWKWLIEENDPRQIWCAINWRGTFDTKIRNSPSNQVFADYFKRLFGESDSNIDYNEAGSINNVYIPLLDDPISEREVRDSIKLLKGNKAAGPDGISPGILKLLNDSWVELIVYLVNIIFYTYYPDEWTKSKLITIYKKGDALDPSNYRGINIMSVFPKLYDIILSQRLQKWFTSDEEQAGAKKGRGCEEQILALRLLIDIARKDRKPLYIIFIDFEKAYDKVLRWKLVEVLRSFGCGSHMLQAIKSSLQKTTSIIDNVSIDSKVGVRQGSPSSCFLFTAYVNPMIRMVKEYGEDGWLGLLHILLLMDDTIILSTTREGAIWKFQQVLNYCSQYGMKVNQGKTKYMCVNTNDRDPMVFDGMSVCWCESYIYLGNVIMNTAIHKQVEKHLKSNTKNIHKFQSFLAKNDDAPFHVKAKVWAAALNSSLFYGAETWWTSNLKMATKLHLGTLKDLLNVRNTVCTELVYLESGMGSASANIMRRQLKYVRNLMARPGYNSSYLSTLISKATEVRSPMGMYLQALLNIEGDPVENELILLQQKVMENVESSRRITYRMVNPELRAPAIYSSREAVPEHHRAAYTRIRLGSHRLKVETGRWSRIPRERRLCSCGSVQDEDHVLLRCPLMREVRGNFSSLDYRTLENLMMNENVYRLCKYIYIVIKKMEEINKLS